MLNGLDVTVARECHNATYFTAPRFGFFVSTFVASLSRFRGTTSGKGLITTSAERLQSFASNTHTSQRERERERGREREREAERRREREKDKEDGKSVSE